MKKYVVLGLILSLSMHAEEKTKLTVSHQNTLTVDQKLKSVEDGPRYGAYINSKNCSFEVFINDIPVIKYNDDSGNEVAGSYFQLNEGILKKGNQKITIRITPGLNKDQNALDSMLSTHSEIKIKIVKSLKDKTGNIEENEVGRYSTAKKKLSDKKFFEDKFTFFADVSYHIETLDNAEVLFTDDKDKLQNLEQEVIAKYNNIRNVYINGSWSALANMYYNRERRIAKQLYLLPDEIKNRWNGYIFRTKADITSLDIKPIEDYKMTFYADGKIVCLQKIDNEKSALWGSFKRKGKDNAVTTYITLYLYRSKGSKDLEVY